MRKKVVTDGLEAYFDTANPKSFQGKPTTNHAGFRNPRIDPFYAPYEYTTDATFKKNHIRSIRAYTSAGSELSNLVNTGVNSGNWQVTRHAHWQYDEFLRKPVVVMHDYDGQWKAWSFGGVPSYTSMGLGYGDTFTISWMQWTDDIAKAPNVGLYNQNTSGTNGFHNGQSNAHPTAFNTKPNTWQRVWATFTVNAVNNLNVGINLYAYGHYTKRGIVKMTDLQLEVGIPSQYIETSRATTDVLKNPLRGSTKQFDVTDMSYDATDTSKMIFDGSGTNNGVTLGNHISLSGWSAKTTDYPAGMTIDVWFKMSGAQSAGQCLFFGAATIRHIEIRNEGSATPSIRTEAGIENGYSFGSGTIPGGSLIGRWVNLHIVFANAESGRPVRWYHNGELFHTGSLDGGANPGTEYFEFTKIGRSTGSVDFLYAQSFKGEMPIFRLYSKALSEAEVKQNYNATSGRFV